MTSECLASDRSSSIATVCGGSIALMDIGIQVRAHVGAFSVGLVSVSDPEMGRVTDYRIFTDILGLEDHLGDMDFKIAGTKKEITAIQLDIKPAGVALHILCEALEPVLVDRSQILDFMEQVISRLRDSSRENLPRSGTMNIQMDSIGRLIRPRGSNVKNIQRVADARVSITGDDEHMTESERVVYKASSTSFNPSPTIAATDGGMINNAYASGFSAQILRFP